MAAVTLTLCIFAVAIALGIVTAIYVIELRDSRVPPVQTRKIYYPKKRTIKVRHHRST